jgi:beta-lactamase superfamily II metal-dependent hydrolase
MSFQLISDNDRVSATLAAPDRASFRASALEIRIYYVPEGETILITRGRDALLMDGGSGRTLRHPALAQAIAGELQGRRLRAIVASHPHRDHTNSHSNLVGAVTFAPGARYFDNGIPAADANFQRITNDHPSLPFRRVAVLPNQRDDANRIVPRIGGAGADVHVLRSSTNATTHAGQVYWSVFVFLRLRNAWMLFTGDVITKLYQTRMTPRLQALNPRTHFLKLSHHGNRTGTSEDFVSALRPAIAVASTDNDPGHELDDEVRTRLANVNSQVLATFDPNRAAAVRARDIIIRTDGFIWSNGNVDGVLFEVMDRQPAIHLGQ